MQQLQEIEPGSEILPLEWLNAIAREVIRLSKIEVEGADVEISGTNTLIRLPRPRPTVPAKLTSESSGKYAWVEVERVGADSFATVTGGRSGDATVGAAREVNGTTGIAANTYVWLTPGWSGVSGSDLDQEWLFAYEAGSGGGSTSITVREADGSPSGGASSITLNQASGLGVTLSGGSATFTMNAPGNDTELVFNNAGLLGALPKYYVSTSTTATDAASMWLTTRSDTVHSLLTLYRTLAANGDVSSGGVIGTVRYSAKRSGAVWDYGQIEGSVNAAITEGKIILRTWKSGPGDSDLVTLEGNKLGFYHGSTPVAKQTVTGSRGGNAALADLMTALAALGLVVDGTS